MIPRSEADFQPQWKKLLANAVSSPMELLHMLELENSTLAQSLDASPSFRLRVPRGFIGKMKKGDPEDPLLKQVLPLTEENLTQPGYQTDPVGDLAAEAVDGVLHKYQGRALLITTGACGIHCRYCFRRHFPYAQSNPARDQWQQALDYIRKTPSVTEVILSGGDPLSLSDQKLARLVCRIEQIPHVKRLRIHSRMPVILPERIDRHLLDWIGTTHLQTIMVIHANHANEIDRTVAHSMNELAKTGVTLLNQSVLLAGVNDSFDALIALSERLFEAHVMPYYLHLLDPVQGAAHFNVECDHALALMEQIRNRLPGYLVPKLVQEKPGAGSKITIS